MLVRPLPFHQIWCPSSSSPSPSSECSSLVASSSCLVVLVLCVESCLDLLRPRIWMLAAQRLLWSRSEPFRCSTAQLNFQPWPRPISVRMLQQGRGSLVIKRTKWDRVHGVTKRASESEISWSLDQCWALAILNMSSYVMHCAMTSRVINEPLLTLFPSRHRALCVHSSHVVFSAGPCISTDPTRLCL